MNVIIEFPLGRTKLPGTVVSKKNQAEIVIFPGVRIERREFSLADRVDTARNLSARQGALQAALED